MLQCLCLVCPQQCKMLRQLTGRLDHNLGWCYMNTIKLDDVAHRVVPAATDDCLCLRPGNAGHTLRMPCQLLLGRF